MAADPVVSHLQQDVSNFEAQIDDLRGRKESLATEIVDIDARINSIEPIYTYARSLLERAKPVEGSATKSKAGAKAPLA